MLFALVAPGVASAYTIESQITAGCHESISEDALRNVRTGSSFTLAPALPSTQSDDDPIIDDVPFHVPDDFKDIGSVTLLIGVRDNDVKELGPTALDQLAELTADPSTQREHCLRTNGEVEPTGSAMAVAECRAFIKEKLMAALDGLGPNGAPDGSLREPLTTHFALRGKLTVNLPRFYLHAGQAIHAIQDSFTHTFRTATDQHRISVSLDWIDYADNTLDEATDGPPHMRQLDRCDDPDALRTQRHALAIEASAAALHIALDPTLTRDAKSAAFDQVLDTYILYDGSGNCTAANGWCNATENQYRASSCACDLSKHTRSDHTLLALGALACGLLVRRHRRRAPSAKALKSAAALALLTLSAPHVASAGEEAISDKSAERKAGNAVSPDASPTQPGEPLGISGPVAAINGESKAGTPGKLDKTGAFFGHAAFGASYDHAALGFTVGAKYQILKQWMVGLDGEWNPWLPTEPFSFRAGTLNVYASFLRRYQMVWESVNFRTTAALGVSTLLMNLPGAPKGSFGPLAGISFLGVEIKMAPGFFLVIDPSYFIFDAPHLTGAPLVYYQYRFQVGIEFGG